MVSYWEKCTVNPWRQKHLKSWEPCGWSRMVGKENWSYHSIAKRRKTTYSNIHLVIFGISLIVYLIIRHLCNVHITSLLKWKNCFIFLLHRQYISYVTNLIEIGVDCWNASTIDMQFMHTINIRINDWCKRFMCVYACMLTSLSMHALCTLWN